VEICRRVDGIPLAIELAASRMASMTAIEVRDRMHQRFRLLVGSRRGLERHQTLRHAVAWSYDLLDDSERALLDRCSVFAGGFDLESACAITGSDDDLGVLDLLDALVRKSLLVADGSAGRTRYSMLETIRQFAEERLAESGASTEVRSAHARYFAGREADVMALWDSPRQREAYAWFAAEMPNLRTAFRWAADSGDLDTAATVATYATMLGYMVENFEAVAWAEELIEAARAVDHPRLAYLYLMASTCYNAGRVEDGVRYCDAGQQVIESGRFAMPFGIEGMLGTPWLVIGQSQRWVDLCHAEAARGRDTHTFSWSCLVFALVVAGRTEEAIAAVDGLVDAAEITHNPAAHSFALLAEGFAFRAADPMRALDALRRGLVIARETGNRLNESHMANVLSEIETQHGDPQAALDYLALAIRNYHDSGNTAMVRSPLSLLAVLFHGLGRYEPAATVAGFAINPLAAAAFPEINAAIAHMRDVLGERTHESLARRGAAMTTSAMVAFAYDEIDQARAELEAVSE
jgi:hypothetical protein